MQKISLIKQNILQYLKYKGVTKYDFYKKSGITRGVLNHPSGMSEDNIAKFIAYEPKINTRWLITGTGSMLNNSKTKEDKAAAHKSTVPGKGIPYINVEAVAGFGSTDFAIEDNNIVSRYYVPDFKNVDFMMPVTGQSMEPSYLAGDIIACRILKELSFIQWNRIHLISTESQGLLVKRLRKGKDKDHYLLVSDNQEYDAFEIPKREIKGIALVIRGIRLE